MNVALVFWNCGRKSGFPLTEAVAGSGALSHQAAVGLHSLFGSEVRSWRSGSEVGHCKVISLLPRHQ